MTNRIKTYTIGDDIPDDAMIIGQQHFVDFKKRQRVAEFYFLVPEKKARSPRKR